MRSTVRIITTVIAIILIGVVVFLAMTATNCGKSDFKTFRVYLGEEELIDGSSFMFERGETYSFNVQYTFDVGEEKKKDYTVKIVPNSSFAVPYTLDGRNRNFATLDAELSEVFNLEKGADGFIITIDKDFNLTSLLEKVHPERDIKTMEKDITSTPLYYTLIILSEDEKQTITINFGVNIYAKEIGVTEEIVFDGKTT